MSATHSARGPVSYDSGNHFQVLCQCYGSAWPRVLPYCVANAVFMIVLTLVNNNGNEWGITGQGHSFAGLIVSFLVVSRINTALARYNECRNNIGTMYREARELIQNALVFSKRNKKNTDISSKEWRCEVAYRTMLLLRTSIAVVQYQSEKVPAWDVQELSGFELEYCQPGEISRRHAQTSISGSVFTDSMRVPLQMAYLLRQSICSQEEHMSDPMALAQEMKLLGSVDSFLNGYYGMRKFLTTPVPFPLVQMTRTIVLFYVFTIPFVFLDDNSSHVMAEHCIAVFLLTYGFMGLELVSIELDDPFGDDANDFDCLVFTHMVFEDTYLLVHDADGVEWADGLRHKINENITFPIMTKKERLLLETETLLPSPQESYHNGEDRSTKSGNRGRFWRGRRKREIPRAVIEQRTVHIDGDDRRGPANVVDLETGSSEH